MTHTHGAKHNGEIRAGICVLFYPLASRASLRSGKDQHENLFFSRPPGRTLTTRGLSSASGLAGVFLCELCIYTSPWQTKVHVTEKKIKKQPGRVSSVLRLALSQQSIPVIRVTTALGRKQLSDSACQLRFLFVAL